ncbi:glycosyltransferase BC10-like [Wolffia australiana]
MKTHLKESLPLSISFFPFLSRFPLLFLALFAGFLAGTSLTSLSSPVHLSVFSTPSLQTTPSSNSSMAILGLNDLIQPKWVLHNMTDAELLWRASMAPLATGEPFRRVPKVAFLFLVRGAVPLAPLWDKFFAGHEGFFSIYVHGDPFYNDTTPPSSAFFGRRVPSKVVKWGKLSMVEAERRLLGNALLDMNNERFVLLSEACIPLYSFPEIYSYLINSSSSFVQSIDEPGPAGRGRYSRRMAPTVRASQWRKGSQWFELDRFLALRVVSDVVFFPVFSKFCRAACYADEHYLPTMVTSRWPARNANRSLTWVDWSAGGPHPARFWRPAVTEALLRRMRTGSTCEYNGRSSKMCFLFARKFLPGALPRLLRFAPKTLGFG